MIKEITNSSPAISPGHSQSSLIWNKQQSPSKYHCNKKQYSISNIFQNSILFCYAGSLLKWDQDLKKVIECNLNSQEISTANFICINVSFPLKKYSFLEIIVVRI